MTAPQTIYSSPSSRICKQSFRDGQQGKKISHLFQSYGHHLGYKLRSCGPLIISSAFFQGWTRLEKRGIAFSSFFLSTTKNILNPLETFTKRSQASQSISVSRFRPTLEPPSMFALVFDVHKMMTAMNHSSVLDAKKQMEHLEEQRNLRREQKLSEWKKQREKSEVAARWSTAMAVFSWISIGLEIFTGIALIATGNVVGGSLLLAGGIVQLTSHIMMQTGGWDKVAEELPGNDIEQKRKVVSWMQIGVLVFSMILAGAGGAMVGTSSIKSGMQTASTLSLSGVMIGSAIVTIGHGIYQSDLKEVQSNLQKIHVEIQKSDLKQQQLRDKIDDGIKLNKRCVQLMTSAIKKQSEVFSLISRAM